MLLSLRQNQRAGTGEFLMTDIIYFESVINPQSGELTLNKVEAPRSEHVAALIVYDPTNADPTLARFYEAKDEDDEQKQ